MTHYTTDEVRKHTLAQANAYLTHLQSGDWEAYAALWAEDATFEFPYAPDGQPRVLHGKDAILTHMTSMMRSLVVDDVPVLEVVPAADPEMVVAELEMQMRVVSTGTLYHQRYVTIFTFEGGLLRTYREYSNPLVFLRSFAPPEAEPRA